MFKMTHQRAVARQSLLSVIALLCLFAVGGTECSQGSGGEWGSDFRHQHGRRNAGFQSRNVALH